MTDKKYIREFDEEGRPIFGAPTFKPESKPEPKPEPKPKPKFQSKTTRVDFAENIRTARSGGNLGYCTIEALYQAFKQRLMRELELGEKDPER